MAISVPQGDVIKVVSFNLRRDFGPQRKNRWESRKELAARMIAESDAAIIGVQEFLPKMRQDLKTLLDGYSIFGKGRLSGKDPGNDEHSDIIIKNNDVEWQAVRHSGSPSIRMFQAELILRFIQESAPLPR